VQKCHTLYDEHINIKRKQLLYLGSEVFTAVVMESTIFWDITPCSPLTLNELHSVISQKMVLFNYCIFYANFRYNTSSSITDATTKHNGKAVSMPAPYLIHLMYEFWRRQVILTAGSYGFVQSLHKNGMTARN
jgi:hypothetical protein